MRAVWAHWLAGGEPRCRARGWLQDQDSKVSVLRALCLEGLQPPLLLVHLMEQLGRHGQGRQLGQTVNASTRGVPHGH